MLDVIGKARNIDLFWDLIKEIAHLQLITDKTCKIAIKTLASAREMKKCVEFFHVINGFGYGYSLERLNKVIDALCGDKLAEEAKYIVVKMKDWIKPDGFTYKCLICGFCDVGDLVEASKIWNLMADEGFELEFDGVEKMMDTLFKLNRFDEAMMVFESIRVNRIDDLGVSTYKLVIGWMCKKGKLGQAQEVFDEMLERRIQPDSIILASLIYCFLSKARVREAYEIAEGVEKPDISIYHRLIKGLLRLKRANDFIKILYFEKKTNKLISNPKHSL